MLNSANNQTLKSTINTSEFEKMKKIRENRKKKDNEIVELQNEVSEIKSLLKQLLEKS